MECINCTLCIDACDMVMTKLNRPTRLIGFKSEEEITTGKPFKIHSRIYAYTAVLVVLMSVLTVLLVRRTDIDTTLLRAKGTLYQLKDDGTVSNLYNAELINKTNGKINFEIKPEDPDTKIQFIRKANSIEKGGREKLTFFISRPQQDIQKYKSDIKVQILSEGRVIENIETTFIAPPNTQQ